MIISLPSVELSSPSTATYLELSLLLKNNKKHKASNITKLNVNATVIFKLIVLMNK